MRRDILDGRLLVPRGGEPPVDQGYFVTDAVGSRREMGVRGPMSVMHRSGSSLLACALGCLGVLLGLGVRDSASAVVRGRGATPAVIAVIAGKPTELAFRLSRSSLLPWSERARKEVLTFRVTNEGAQPHDFEVCTAPVKRLAADACPGKATRRLDPGQSAMLTVGFVKRGLYEYLSTVPGDAAGGMKGLIGVGVKLPPTAVATPPATTTPAATTAPTVSTPGSGASSLVGDPNAGKAVFLSSGCGSCHALAAAGADGDVGASLDMVKPTQAVVVQYVTDGSSSMPAYAGTLTPDQIDDVAAYVYLTTHTIN
jgi:cytochrome c6